ncbi:MAG: zinc metalloprotease, partial [Saprospiraceae bacterium]|nr:zinc metalloprotease [Saprospiraceae bacterium]
MKRLLHLSLLICFSLTCLAQADLNLEAYQAYVEELTKIKDTVTLKSILIPPVKSPADLEPCGHKKYNPSAFDPEKQRVFENRLQEFVTEQKKKIAARGLERVQIPVVVHVIHQGSAAGVGENISEAQIMSQIQALNDAFNRTSQTRYSGLGNNAGLNYNTLTATSEIEFVLASVDPQGNPSNGINRVEVLKGYHLIPDFIDEIIKPATIWNPDYYLNFWSTRLFDGVKPGLLGYAVFPTLSGLPGIDFSANPSSDGIVCDYRTVGSNEYGDNFDLEPNYQFGVIAVHEVGHFLGLRHIWGDGDSPDVGCSVDDFVDDTPNAAFRSLSCETNESCGSVDLNENYMDYGSDFCKNVFTNGQILRMRTVLSVSPRRASLISSPVLQGLPIPVSIQPPNDLCAQALPITCGQTY